MIEGIFSHDGFGILAELSRTECAAADADLVLVAPLSSAGFTAFDWCLCSPDGRLVGFISDRSGPAQVYEVHVRARM